MSSRTPATRSVEVELGLRLAEAQDTIRAIGAGEVDGFVLSDGDAGPRVFTLDSADRPYRMFVENMRDGAVTVSATGVILFANRRLGSLLAVATEAIVGTPLARFVRGDVSALLKTVGPTGEGVTIELDLIDSDGAPLSVLAGTFPLEVGGEVLTCITFTDLRARRAQAHEIARLLEAQTVRTGELEDAQAEQQRVSVELTESDERLQAILDNSPTIVHVKDLDGRYIFVNQQCVAAFGIARERLLGRLDRDIWPDNRSIVSRAEDLQVLRSGQAHQSEQTVTQSDGEHTYLTVTFPLFDASGVPYGTSGISTDISDRKAAERERQSLEERLHQSQRLESLGQLAGGVAHDFNNLLAVIINYADFVAAETAGEVRDDVDQIRAAAEKAARLTHQLLIFARRESVRREQLDLNEIVAEMHALLARSIGEQVELVVRSEAALPAIYADRGQIDQLILNLVFNARDAMPDGGTLMVATRCVELDAGSPRLHGDMQPGRFVELSVGDTGTGMSPVVIAHAFEPFFTTKPQGEGTGLGLATVYGIVNEAGGSIDIESEVGAGTTFRICFQLESSTGDAPPRAELAPAPKGRGEAILVVDDLPAMLTVTSRLLERNGYQVLQAGSGDEAIAIAADHDFDLLLTDSVMPRMSGSALAEVLQRERPTLAVLFMSGYGHRLGGREGLPDDDSVLIQKPFTEHELLVTVATALRERLQAT